MAERTDLPWRATYNEERENHTIETDYGGHREMPLAFTATHYVSGSEPANAAFIVQACNAHYDLVEALEASNEVLKLLTGQWGDVSQARRNANNAALAKARGEGS